jgi:hypothetical protein
LTIPTARSGDECVAKPWTPVRRSVIRDEGSTLAVTESFFPDPAFFFVGPTPLTTKNAPLIGPGQ